MVSLVYYVGKERKWYRNGIGSDKCFVVAEFMFLSAGGVIRSRRSISLLEPMSSLNLPNLVQIMFWGNANMLRCIRLDFPFSLLDLLLMFTRRTT